MRLKSEQRLLLGKLARTNIPKKVLMITFGVSRKTVWFWGKQNLHYVSDLPRTNHRFKITVETEITIIAFRNNFGYGTARIQQRLFCAPSFELEQMEVKVQGVELSRQAINEVLKNWGINGYRRKRKKAWKFFRAKYANELWQLDLKRFKFQGKKYELLVCIDDYSRYILLLHVFDHSPDIPEISKAIKILIEKYHPEKILTDNNPFQKSWEDWCLSLEVKAIFAHPYYPQDKGKVERTIRNITEEFIDLLSKFAMFFERIQEYKDWFNDKRYHRGIKDYPAKLFVTL
jgi:hypothetical protein